MLIDPHKAAIAATKLREAEIEYLLANGWIHHKELRDDGKFDDKWSFPKTEYVQACRYQRIPLDRAVIAQKTMSNLRGYWAKSNDAVQNEPLD